jgi:ABC-type dipeptide/oligopeptide/nickel transport system permease subunit
MSRRSVRSTPVRRFLRHRGAVIGAGVLASVTLLAVTSIGAVGLPGWWPESYSQVGDVHDGGRMTLDLVPAFWDGDGMVLGRHPFGQDDAGRDYFALTMRGIQVSLGIAVTVGVVATILGTVIGAVAGVRRGWPDVLLMRTVDVVLAVPLLMVAAVVGQYPSHGPFLLALLLGALTWTTLARLVRADFLRFGEVAFVEAARASGAGDLRIVLRHLLPHSWGTIVVNATLTVALAILLETSVSYLGFGVRPPDTSLGRLIGEHQTALMVRPWLFWWPGSFIVTIAVAVNLIGDGLRDAFDPRYISGNER